MATTNGRRTFAPGDRIMFLRNERSLGVKNGSLGRVDSVTATRMAVMLDDATRIAFDIKDYADIDHGYAATIHKAQGVTVDRTHVLATPGLDRHAAYVALSRHRHGVDVHYGRDDFADRDRLSATLSRERTKDMASDYPGGAPERQIAPEPPSPRGRLAGLKLDTTPLSSPGPSPLDQAVLRFARATRDIVRMRQQNLDELPHQRAAFDEARHALDALRSGGARDLRAAFVRDMKLLDEVAAGDAKLGDRVMDWERRYRTDPQLRADQFVKRWQQLDRKAKTFERDWEHDRAASVRAAMTDMAKALHRDPQMESLLRNRKLELKSRGSSGQEIGQELVALIGRGRGLSR